VTHAPTSRYHFSRVADNLRPQLDSGVPHGGEIAAVFDLGHGCGCPGAPLTEADRAASLRIADYCVAFARDGIPAPSTRRLGHATNGSARGPSSSAPTASCHAPTSASAGSTRSSAPST